MRLTRVLPVAAVLLVFACTSADILRLDPTPRPETAPSSIQLIGQEPKRPYTVIAIVSARSGNDDLAQARTRLIKEAARLGGQAVLLDASSLTRIRGDVTERPQLTGKVIVFSDSTGAN